MTPPTEIIFFVDRAISQKFVPTALRTAGAIVEIHTDHFAPEAPDVEWLPAVSQKGWVVLTKDSNIGRNPLELIAIARANAKVFILVSGNLNRQQMAEILVVALDRLQKLARGNKAPFVAKIYKGGKVKIWKSRSQLLKLLS